MSSIIDLSNKTPTEKFYVALFKELPKHDLEESDIPSLFDVLDTFPPRRAIIIVRFFGLGSIKHLTGDEADADLGTTKETIPQIAKSLNLTPERTLQIKDMALRKLRHPDRAQKIQALFRPRVELRTEISELNDEISTLKSEVATLKFKLFRATEQAKNTPKADPEAVGGPCSMRIADLDFSARTCNGLVRHRAYGENIEFLGDITLLSRDDVLSIRNLGRKSLEEIEEKLGSFGLTLKDA